MTDPRIISALKALEEAYDADEFDVNAAEAAILSARDSLRSAVDDAPDAERRIRAAAPRLLAELEHLTARCDGEAGILADGSNLDTLAAHAAILPRRGL